MAETLKTIILLHRVLFIVSLAILAVSLSVKPPITTYAQATAEIENLQEAVAAVSEQVKIAYSEIYSRSTLMAAIGGWRHHHGMEEQKIDVLVDNPPEYVVPDAEDNPTVTLGSQIKWADRIYRDIGMPFFLCEVDKTQVIQNLDQMLADNPSAKLRNIHIYIHKEANAAAESKRFSCEIELTLEESAESFSGNRALNLGVPSRALQVVSTDPWIDLGVEGTLKEHGLGDFEDLHHLGVFSIRDVWEEIENRPPEAALAFLRKKKDEEYEKGKEKIEIIGVNVNGKMTIALATSVELMLMLYLSVQIASLNLTLRSGGVKGIDEGPFFGPLRLRLGWSVVVFSLFLLPTVVSGIALLVVFPTLLEGMSSWARRGWILFQWGLFGGILASGVHLVGQVHRTAVLLYEGDESVL